MTRQDLDVHEPAIRLRAVLALLRVIAGRRGRSRLRWSGAGFVYELTATRTPPVAFALDAAPTAENLDVARSRLWDAFGP